jgi:SAM-dependent methyltransferase
MTATEIKETIYRLDGPLRSAIGETEQLLRRVRLMPDSTVLDVGAGTGYLSLPLARVLDEGGCVYALDTCGELLQVLETKASQRGLDGRIRTSQGSALRLEYPSASFDFVFSSYLLHELAEQAPAALREMHRVLKPLGEIVLADYRLTADQDRCRQIEEWYQAQADGAGPGELHLRFRLQDIESMLLAAGFHNIRLSTWMEFHMHAVATR